MVKILIEVNSNRRAKPQSQSRSMLSTPVRRSGVLAAGAASSTVGNPSSGSGFSSTRIEHQLWDLATSGSVEIGEVVAATPSSSGTSTATSTSTTASASRLEILAKSTAKTSGSKYRYRGYNSTTCMHEFVLLIPKSQQPTLTTVNNEVLPETETTRPRGCGRPYDLCKSKRGSRPLDALSERSFCTCTTDF